MYNYLFYVLCNNQSRTTCIWSWILYAFSIIIYYIIIIVFYASEFWSSGIGLHDEIDLFSPPFYWYLQSEGIDLLVTPDSFRGIESHVTPALFYSFAICNSNYAHEVHLWSQGCPSPLSQWCILRIPLFPKKLKSSPSFLQFRFFG